MFRKSPFSRTALLGGLAALALACSSDGPKKTSETGTGSTEGKDSPQVKVDNLEGCTDCNDYVIDRLLIPVNLELWQQFSRDLTGDGQVDNALGKIVYQVLNLYNDVDVQEELDEVINEGEALVVLRLKSDSSKSERGALSDGAKVTGQIWLADDEKCCEDGDDEDACAIEAEQTCFGGSYTFKPELDKASALAVGRIEGDLLTLDAQQVTIRVKIFGEPTTLSVRDARVEAKIAGDRVVDGKLTGVIDKDELQRSVIARLGDWLNGFLSDEDTKPAIKSALGILDENKDGVITLSELTGGILSQVFAGDVDLDDNGTKELSVGFGFSAVSAKIDG